MWLIIRTTKYFRYNNKCWWKKFNVDIEIFSAQGRASFLHIMLPPLWRNKEQTREIFQSKWPITFPYLMIATAYLSYKLMSSRSHNNSSRPNYHSPYGVVNVTTTYTVISFKSWLSRCCRHFYQMIYRVSSTP